MGSILNRLGATFITTAIPSERDKIYIALLHNQDSEINAEAEGFKDLLFTAYAYMNEISDQTHETIVLRLKDMFPAKNTVMFLGKLKAKTYELLTQSDIRSAERATLYINHYFRLAILRTLVLWQVFCFKLRSGFGQSSTKGF